MRVLTVVRRELQGLWSDGKGKSLVAVATTWGLLLGSRMVFPVILPHLQTTYGLSLTAAGFLVTILWFFGSLGQLPGGILADKYNERTVMAVSTFSVAVALGLVVSATSTLVLFVATAMWGLGHSFYPVARITFLSNLYSEQLGSALGVTMATGDIGQTVLPPIAVVLTAVIAWQAGLGFIAPLLLIAGSMILITSFNQNAPEKSSSTRSLRETINVFREFRDPTMGFIILILFLYMFIWQAFTSFYPVYLTADKGVSSLVASLLFGFFFAMGVLVKPVSGGAYDRIGMRKSLVAILLPSVVGFTLLPFITNTWILIVITGMISMMLGSGVVTQSYLADAFSKEMRGTGLGVVRTTTASVAASGPVVFGAIGDRGYFDEGYIALAVIMAAVIVLALWMPDTNGDE